jgi:hypothetical protein
MARAELEKLSSKELHDRAVGRAVKHLDVSFLWKLVTALPAAEAASGNVAEADRDVMSVSALLNDLVHSDEGRLADSLRPLYIEYLEDRD